MPHQRQKVTGDSRHWLGFRARVKGKKKTSKQRHPVRTSRVWEKAPGTRRTARRVQ